MKRQDYIKKQACELKKLVDRKEKMNARYCSGNLTPSAMQKLNADLNWNGMYISQTEERLAFALGLLLPENSITEYRPSPFHRYNGIRKELEKIKFDT